MRPDGWPTRQRLGRRDLDAVPPCHQTAPEGGDTPASRCWGRFSFPVWIWAEAIDVIGSPPRLLCAPGACGMPDVSVVLGWSVGCRPGSESCRCGRA